MVPDVNGCPSKKPLLNLHFSTSADVRRRPDYKLSRRKQGFESPRERQARFGAKGHGVLQGRGAGGTPPPPNPTSAGAAQSNLG
jgi:hypothetical protein